MAGATLVTTFFAIAFLAAVFLTAVFLAEDFAETFLVLVALRVRCERMRAHSSALTFAGLLPWTSEIFAAF